MRVIVTGSSGLLGRHTAAALVAGRHEVAGVDTVPARTAIRHATADLTDLEAALRLVRDADAVIHAAAIPRPTGRPAAEVFSTNVAITYNVVEAAVLNGIRHLVYASSYSVLGPPFNVTPFAPRFFPIDARHPTAPQDAYALSKRLGEEIVAAAVRRSRLTAISLRLAWIQTPESFGREVAARRVEPGFGARNLWSYVDARDAGAACAAAVGAETSGHRALFFSAADTFMEEATAALVSAAYPDAALERPLVGTEGVFDLSDARVVLGLLPGHSWRSY